MKRLLSKSKLSQYLRSKCDRQLYLSLFSDQSEVKSSDIPLPLKSRPGVQIITKSGREFEREQYEELHRTLPGMVICKNNGKSDIELADALMSERDSTPYFILQPIFQPQEFRETALANLGLTTIERSYIPQLAGLIPDALHVFKHKVGDFEILPDGRRKALQKNDKRLGLSVIDLKNVTESNASYAAEICLYAFFLTNWLALQSELKKKYFVSDKLYLWKHVEMPKFSKIRSLISSSDNQKAKALLEDLEEGLVDFVTYMPSVRKFFKEDVPRVIEQGDSSGWHSLEYHVNPRCSACDWLGNSRWLTTEDKKIFDANPQKYCLPVSITKDHLSKIPGLSKGASKILISDGHSTVADLIDISPSAPVLRRHSLLKKDRSQIGERARALITESTSIDTSIKLGGLAKSISAEYSIIVNFDAGSGLLTGLAIQGMLFPPYGRHFTLADGSTTKHHVFEGEAFVVEKDILKTEYVAVRDFISALAKWTLQAESIYRDNGFGTVHSQICFWEERQYEELCNAVGRHLLQIIDLTQDKARALTWLFPPEEIMERDQEIAPGIVFVSEIVNAAVRLPVNFVNTLLDVAEVYSIGYKAHSVDAYYREPLSNAIPRERIFEIWKSTTGTVRMFGEEHPKTKAIEKYGKVLINHTWALASVTRKLRSDFRGRMTGNAPKIDLSVPAGVQKVAYDSKMWIQWDNVESKSAVVQSKAQFTARAEQLEASYTAIVLGKCIEVLGNNTYRFEISEDSTEAKLEAGNSYYVLGIVSEPGFPLMTLNSLNITSTNIQGSDYFMPMYAIIRVAVNQLDRVNKQTEIQLLPRYKAEAVFNAVVENYIDIENMNFYVMEGAAYDDSKKTTQILRAIGNPICASVDPAAQKSLGSPKKVYPKGNDIDSPIARVLWDAPSLMQTTIRSEQQAKELIIYLDSVALEVFNESQKEAIKTSLTKQLSVIWGPPGTGKTNTLAAFLQTLVYEGQKSSQTKKILITGPNYRAVDELADKLLQKLNTDSNCIADLIWVYSSSRQPKELPFVGQHIDAYSINIGSPDANVISTSLNNQNRMTIIATVAHNSARISEELYGKGCAPLQNIFDLIIIDESSQVPVTLAMRPLALLKPTAQVVVAGDHLQMPPIFSLEAPRGAEHLVGSLQTYLIQRFKLRCSELLINYRSNKDLVDFQKTLGYPQNLISSDSDRKLELLGNVASEINKASTKIINTDAYEDLLSPESKVIAVIYEDEVSSQANEVEAKLVAGIAYLLRYTMSSSLLPKNCDAQPYDDEIFFKIGLGVVTPHKAQKALVIGELQKIFPDAPAQIVFDAVDTVERFQGSQRQSVIVSFGVGDTDIISGEEKFLLQMERMNVSVSRAMAKCIVIMPKSLAYHLPTDTKAVNTSKAIKSYVEEFCSNKKPIEINYGDAKIKGELRWH